MAGEFSAAVRRLIVARDEERCLMCARPQPEGGHLHHRQLRSQQGRHAVENGVLLCAWCHHSVHMNVGTSRASGFIVPSWATPGDVAVKTWRGWVLLGTDGSWLRTESPVR